MDNPIKAWQQFRRESQALVRIVEVMQAEDALMVGDLERQVREKFAAMTPDERVEAAAKLRRAIRE